MASFFYLFVLRKNLSLVPSGSKIRGDNRTRVLLSTGRRRRF